MRQAQAFGGAAYMAFLVEGDEVAKLSKIHKSCLSKKLENRNGRCTLKPIAYAA
ncbi:hypothetical protein D3C80_1818660 [compost metagenome]